MAFAEKKQAIIDAAVSVLSRKGQNATVAEIAVSAGVKSSIIYHYFGNKTDLLFYAVGKSLQLRLADLDNHLAGLREPVSRLRKLIWYQLTYHDDEPEYAKFSIFDCRTHRDFFKHEGSASFLRWINLLNEILKDGMADGSFSRDISVPIVNSMVLGLLDMENIQIFTGHQEGNTRDDFNDILDLVLPIVMRRSDHQHHQPEKRAGILEAAESVFAEKGFDEATTIDIARASNVAEGTLYEYFKGKEDILFSGMEGRFAGHMEEIGNLSVESAPPEKLARFIRKHFFLYLKNPSFVKTFISGGIYNENFYQAPAYNTFKSYLEIIDNLLEAGKQDGFFRREVNNRVFKNLFVGCFSHMMLRWFNLTPRTCFDTVYEIDRTVALLLRSILRDNP